MVVDQKLSKKFSKHQDEKLPRPLSLPTMSVDITQLLAELTTFSLKNLETGEANKENCMAFEDCPTLGNALFQLTKITNDHKNTPDYKHIEEAIIKVCQ